MSRTARVALALIFCASSMPSAPLAAQDAVARASVDRAMVRNNESFTYTIRVEGPIRGEPELEPIERQFDVLQRSSTSSVQILNGQTSQITEWQYQLMPRAAGDFTLAPVRVGNLQTNPVPLKVTAPQAPGGGAPADIFMELEAQPTTVYVQSQVVVTLRLFIGVATGRATLTAPEITGGEAIVERLGEDAQHQTERGGRTFLVKERRYAIFPQQAGALTVGPVTFEAMVIPDRGFSRVARFHSSSLELAVQPAVAPPPELGDAAWLPAQRVTLSEHWSDEAPELAVGVPRTRRLTVAADGLLETQLPELPLPQQQGIRQYADQPELAREVAENGLRSRRSVSLAVIAQTPGDVELAALRLPWFNVAEARWEVAELPARTLTITASGEPAAPAAVEAAPAAAAPAQTAAARSFWPIVSAGLGLGWLVTALLWWRSQARTRGGARAAPRPADPRADARKALRDLAAAARANDPDGARRALLEWAEARFPAAPPRSLGALASALPEPAAREVLTLEAHIYGAVEGAWDGQGLVADLPALAAAGAAQDRPEEEPLLPLYR